MWAEKGMEVEAVVPDMWVADSMVLWPNVIDAQRAIMDRRKPCKSWMTFPIIKEKISSGFALYGIWFQLVAFTDMLLYS